VKRRLLWSVPLVLLGAALLYFFVLLPRQIEQAFRAAIPAGVEVTYTAFDLSLVSQRLTLRDVDVLAPRQRFQAEQVTLQLNNFAAEDVRLEMQEVQYQLRDRPMTVLLEAAQFAQITWQGLAPELLQPTEESDLSALLLALPENFVQGVTFSNLVVAHEEDTVGVREWTIARLGAGKLQGVALEELQVRSREFAQSVERLTLEELRVPASGTIELTELSLRQCLAMMGDSALGWDELTLARWENDQFQNFSIRGLKASNLEPFASLRAGAFTAKTLPVPNKEPTLAEQEAQWLTAKLEEVVIEKLEAQLPTQPEPETIERITLGALHLGRSAGGVFYLRDFDLSVEQLRFHTDTLPWIVRQSLGDYLLDSELGLNASVKVRADHVTREMALTLGIGFEELANLSLAGEVRNVPAPLFDYAYLSAWEREHALEQAWPELEIVSLAVGYEERQFLQTTLPQQAEQLGIATEVWIDDFTQEIVRRAREVGFQRAEALGSDLRTFLQNPKSMEVTVKPSTPMRVGEMMMMGLINRDLLWRSLQLDWQVNP
jgi:hypothetical protein